MTSCASPSHPPRACGTLSCSVCSHAPPGSLWAAAAALRRCKRRVNLRLRVLRASTLSERGRRSTQLHGVTRLDYRVLARHNSIRDPYTIFPGQRLLIPQSDDALPPQPIPSEESSDGEAPAGVSTRGTGTQPEPAITPLPPPPASPQPETAASSERVPETTSRITSEPQKPTPAPSAAPSPAEPMAASLPHRTVAGVRWTWPTNGKTIGNFAGAGGKGLDIVGAYEQPIRAAAQGRVVYAGGGLIGYGKLIILKHNSRLLSAYAHNERLHVKEGDAVKGGHHIADMGRSSKGRSMLHFEIRRNGIPVDPVRYLP